MTGAPVTLVVEHNTIGTDLKTSHSADNPSDCEATVLTFKTAS